MTEEIQRLQEVMEEALVFHTPAEILTTLNDILVTRSGTGQGIVREDVVDYHGLTFCDDCQTETH